MSAFSGLSGLPSHVFKNISLFGNAQAHFGDAVLQYTKNKEEVERACLQALRCPDSFAVKNRLKENKDKILYQSFQWIFEDTKYSSWKDGKDIALLWIKGGAGKGKTMMSIGLIEELTRIPEQPAIITYFFCQNADYELNTVEAIIKGLILQLAQQHKETKECLMKHWDVQRQQLSENLRSWRALWDVFLEMIDRCPMTVKIYIVIDGLDECRDEGMTDLLRIIVRTGLTHPARVKWLLTSRPLTTAERELLAGSDQVRIDLELNLRSVSNGIRGYIEYKVSELDRRWQYGPKLRHTIEQQLTVKAEDTFLWVSLVCKCLENVGPRDVLVTIQELPPDLRGLYHRVYIDLYHDQSPIAKGCVRILSAMILALRPLIMAEIGMLADVSLKREFFSAIIDRIALFAIIPRDHVEFVHQSARDYLIGLQNATEATNSELMSGDGEMAMRCLYTLSRRLKADLLDLRRPDATRQMIDQAGEATLEHLKYAATYWVWHLHAARDTMAIRKALARDGLIIRFLLRNLLSWVECLSFIDQIDLLYDALDQLEDMSMSYLEAESPSMLMNVVSDARTLLLPHRDTISKWPLQVYSSVIMFSPRDSIFRDIHMSNVPKWLTRSTYSGDHCATSCQITSIADAVNVTTAAFAPDSKSIATVTRDSTVVIYDTQNCHSRTTLKYEAPIEKVCLSHDGQKLVSVASATENIIIRDIKTTRFLSSIETFHSEKTTVVAISSCSGWIVSGSADKTLKIWNATTSDLVRTLIGHKGPISAVILSSDGRWVASGSSDGVAKMWNFHTGKAGKTLMSHPSCVRALAFSPDGEYLASGCMEGLIKIWRVGTGMLEKSIGGHRNIITTIDFSPDSQRLVSGSDQGLIKIWNVETGHAEQRLSGHTGEVFSIAFIDGGRTVTSFADDQSLRIWNVDPGNGNDLIDSIQSVVFSPNGRYVASATEHRISIWNVDTGRLARTLDDRSNRIKVLVWSQNGHLLLAGSSGGSSEVWNITTGMVEYYITHKDQRVTAAAFSPCGRFIAIGFLQATAIERAPTFAVWDTGTGLLKSIKIKPSPKFHTINAITAIADGWRVAAMFGLPRVEYLFSGYCVNVAWIGDTMQVSPKLRWTRNTTKDQIVLKERQQIPCDWADHLQFSSNGARLNTDHASLVVDTCREQNPDNPEPLLDLSVRRSLLSGSWIYHGEIGILRLPPELEHTCYHTYEDHIAVGFTDGQMLMFTIDRRMLIEAARTWPTYSTGRY